MALADGDRVSLVLSVAPLSEQAFIFHIGEVPQRRGWWWRLSAALVWHGAAGWWVKVL